MGGTVTITPDASNSSPVTITPDSQQQQSPQPSATLSAPPSADAQSQQFVKDHPILSAVAGGGTPLTMPMVKGLTKLHDTLTSMGNMTQEGQKEHPIQAEIGHLANRIEGLLTGNSTNPEDAIGTGQYGMLNNPVTGTLMPMPGSGGAPGAAQAVEGVGSLVDAGGSKVKNILDMLIKGKNVGQADAQAAMRELAEGPGNTAYRARPVGEQGVSASSKMPQATMSESEANGYKSNLSDMSGNPQEVVPIDLEQQPGNFKKYPGPNGTDWVKFDKDIGESEVGQGPLPSNPSLRQSLGGRIDRGESAYKSLYRQVDAASGTNLKDLSDQLDNYQYKMRQAGTPAAEDAWQDKVDEVNAHIAAAKQKAQQAGVDPSMLDKADRIYTKVNAMKDAEKKLFTDPNVISGDQALGKAESLDTDKAITRLQQLRNNTRWGAPRADQAFGKESVDNALTKLYAAQTAGEKAVAMRKVAGWLGIPAGVALAGEAAKTIVGGGK